MAMKDRLESTNRINLLFDFYGPLLTDKQQIFMQHYYHDDYSLGEIAENFHISRQAVYEHIKRAEQTLQDYERQLQLLEQYEKRREIVFQMEEIIQQSPFRDHHDLKALNERIQALKKLDQ